MTLAALKKKIHIYLWKKLKYSVKFKLFLYRIIWFLPKNFRKTDAIWEQLHLLSTRKSQITFINIGSNDGLSGDPLIEFIFRYKWKGLMVEPLPYVFDRLQRVYLDHKNVTCVNVAIAEKSTRKDFYYLADSKHLPPGSDQMGSFDKKHILKYEFMFPNAKKYLRSMSIECLTIEDLLTRYPLPQVDLYLIDTEGYDYEILKLINFSQYKPELIIYEHQHLSDKNITKSKQLLKEQGYSLTSEGGNTVASLLR